MSIAQISSFEPTPGLVVAPRLTIRASRGWFTLNVRELWQFRDLLLSLSARDLKLRYKQTALGVSWVVLQPLLGACVFSFVFGKVAKMPSEGVPYFLFSYAGLLGWNLFSNTLTKCSTCLVGNSQLISKVFFPRLVLPLSTVPSTLVDFAVAAVVLMIMMLMRGLNPGAQILLLPIWMALVITLALGFGLLSAALAVSYRDVQYMMPVFLQIMLYASPVAYAVSAVPAHLRGYYLLNPLSAVLDAFRWSLLGAGKLNPPALLYAAVASVVIFVVGLIAFRRMERKFADVI